MVATITKPVSRVSPPSRGVGPLLFFFFGGTCAALADSRALLCRAIHVAPRLSPPMPPSGEKRSRRFPPRPPPVRSAVAAVAAAVNQCTVAQRSVKQLSRARDSVSLRAVIRPPVVVGVVYAAHRRPTYIAQYSRWPVPPPPPHPTTKYRQRTNRRNIIYPRLGHNVHTLSQR